MAMPRSSAADQSGDDPYSVNDAVRRVLYLVGVVLCELMLVWGQEVR